VVQAEYRGTDGRDGTADGLWAIGHAVGGRGQRGERDGMVSIGDDAEIGTRTLYSTHSPVEHAPLEMAVTIPPRVPNTGPTRWVRGLHLTLD
jgi:hypothetical protein